MNYRDKIIEDIAEGLCKKISRKIIRNLQKMTEGMQSGDDTPLKNIWDEICVQAQGEESVMWYAYLDMIRLFIHDEIEKLDGKMKQVIWLQTDEGIDWEEDKENQDAPVYREDDIAEYILRFVLSTAANWTNKRIEKYFEREYSYY